LVKAGLATAEAALATLLIGGRDVAMIFADVRTRSGIPCSVA
jgi:hypothetical protein